MFRIITTTHAALKPRGASATTAQFPRHEIVSRAGGRAIPATTPARMASSFGVAA